MIILSRKCLMSVQCSKQAASRKGAAISNLYKKLDNFFQKMPKLARWIYQFFQSQSEKKTFLDKFFVKKQEIIAVVLEILLILIVLCWKKFKNTSNDNWLYLVTPLAPFGHELNFGWKGSRGWLVNIWWLDFQFNKSVTRYDDILNFIWLSIF